MKRVHRFVVVCCATVLAGPAIVASAGEESGAFPGTSLVTPAQYAAPLGPAGGYPQYAPPMMAPYPGCCTPYQTTPYPYAGYPAMPYPGMPMAPGLPAQPNWPAQPYPSLPMPSPTPPTTPTTPSTPTTPPTPTPPTTPTTPSTPAEPNSAAAPRAPGNAAGADMQAATAALAAQAAASTQAQASAQAGSDSLASAPAAGTEGAPEFSPQMQGDAFGRRIPVQFVGLGTSGYNQRPPGIIDIPTPTGGGAVGRTKVSDGNNPLPRDRLIIDYDYFSAVKIGAGGLPVNRYSLGFEKTFFGGYASIELRVPFASTLATDIDANGVSNNRGTQLGDAHLTLKALLYQGDTWNIAAGMAVAIPTANDVHAFASSSELLRIRNDATVLEPYVAYLLTPNPDWFIQNWYSLALNTSGNRVQVTDGLTGLQPVGRLYDQSLLQIDAQLGYWLIGPKNYGLVRGLAPFAELHLNTALGKAQTVTGGAPVFSPTGSRFNELNLAVGAAMLLSHRFSVSAGAVIPLSNGYSRVFDYEIAVRGSILFGCTSRARSASALVSSF